MNKYSLGKQNSLIVASLFSFIISLILFIKSYSYYSDEQGTSISFNEVYVIALLISLIALTYLSYKLYKSIKGVEVKGETYVKLTSTALICGYTLGGFFKALFKALSKKVSFSFEANQVYFYIGILFLIMTVYYSFELIEKFKKN